MGNKDDNTQDKLTESNSNTTNTNGKDLKKIGIIIGGVATILATVSKVIDLINEKDN